MIVTNQKNISQKEEEKIEEEHKSEEERRREFELLKARMTKSS